MKSIQARLQQAISLTSSQLRDLQEEKDLNKAFHDSKGLQMCKARIKQLADAQKLYKDIMSHVYWRGV